MSEIVKGKIKDVCPDKRLMHMYMIDVEEAVHTTFKNIGYEPSGNLDFAIDKTWCNSDRTDKLWEFVYKVWRELDG